MKTTITINDKVIELTSRLHKSGVLFPNTEGKGLHNQFMIEVSRQLENGRITKSFPYYDSTANFESGMTDLKDESYLKEAFRCIIEDAQSGTMDFKEFCLRVRI